MFCTIKIGGKLPFTFEWVFPQEEMCSEQGIKVFSEEKKKLFKKCTDNSVNSLLAPVWSFPGKTFQLWCVSVFLLTGNCTLRTIIFGETVEDLFTGSKGSLTWDMNSAKDLLQAPFSWWAFDFLVWWILIQQCRDLVWDFSSSESHSSYSRQRRRSSNEKRTQARQTFPDPWTQGSRKWPVDAVINLVLDLSLIKSGCKFYVKPDGAF